jgi:antitoxin (DNA-binding transcriptional repressor) of toxin-antitoxin stability system
MRALLPDLEATLAIEGEIVVTRRGRPIARLSPLASDERRPSHAAFRARLPFQEVPSEALVRQDRDER